MNVDHLVLVDRPRLMYWKIRRRLNQTQQLDQTGVPRKNQM